MPRITTADELTEALPAPQALLFKHSSYCPVSGLALGEVAALSDAHPDLPIYVIDVIAQRALSNRVAEELDVRHESPQALLLRDGALVWHASHFRVTRERIEEAMEE